MALKTKHFDMRLTPAVNRALKLLADRAGVTKTDYVVNHVRREAKKKGIPT